MVKIKNGALYQWDTGRVVEITGHSLPFEVHFALVGNTEEALVVQPKEIDGILTAEIPNILLQSEQGLAVYLVACGECKVTRKGFLFGVRKRQKPADYVYTETEVKNYEVLEKRISDLEANGKNPVEPDGASLMLVTVTGDKTAGYTADKTYAEIKEAYDKGCKIYLNYRTNFDTFYFLRMFDNRNPLTAGFQFINLTVGTSAITQKQFIITEMGYVNYLENTFTQEKLATKNENETLETTDKTLVGAINELKAELDSLVDGNEVAY